MKCKKLGLFTVCNEVAKVMFYRRLVCPDWGLGGGSGDQFNAHNLMLGYRSVEKMPHLLSKDVIRRVTLLIASQMELHTPSFLLTPPEQILCKIGKCLCQQTFLQTWCRLARVISHNSFTADFFGIILYCPCSIYPPEQRPPEWRPPWLN